MRSPIARPLGQLQLVGATGQVAATGDLHPWQPIDMNTADGFNVMRLTQGDANSFAGLWSPDGQRIVYTAFGPTNSFIASINTDGSGQSTLAAIEGSDEGFPDWSPDGQRIAFTSRRDGNNEIYIMDGEGSNLIRLTNQSGDDFAPSWSPDGAQIAFLSDRDQKAGIYDLYIPMAADGSQPVNLTNDPADDQLPYWRASIEGALPAVQQSSPPITARMLVAPGALMGAGPTSFSWRSPIGATLIYVEPLDGRDVLVDLRRGDRL